MLPFLHWWLLKSVGKLQISGGVVVIIGLALCLQEVVRMPGNPQVHYHLWAALLKNGNQAAGKKEFEVAFKISGNFDGAVKARELLKS